jgi:hypothetical protein
VPHWRLGYSAAYVCVPQESDPLCHLTESRWNLGLGNIGGTSQEQFIGIMKMIVPGSILYVSSLWCIKFALVLFYKKLAAPGSKMQVAYNFALAGLAVTYTTIFFDILFQCYPYDKRWSHDPSYQCSPKASRINYWITILFNIFSDFIIICLPITMVMKLQMKLKQRLAVAFIFALGGFVLIASSKFFLPISNRLLQALTTKQSSERSTPGKTRQC